MLAETEKINIDTPYEIAAKDLTFFKENGYVKLKHVFNAQELAYYEQVITRMVDKLNTQHKAMKDRTTYEKAFLQIMNLWTQDEIVKQFSFSKRLAKIATDLLEVDGIRMYHDQALYKEPSGDFTPWHADQYYWPLLSDRTVTAWIPLQETTLDMGPLAFAAKSDQFSLGRDLAISDESEKQIQDALANAGFENQVSKYNLGEVSFHKGWTFHRAGPNRTSQMRKVMTVIYMDADMKLAEPKNENQQADWKSWCPGAKVGEVINSPLNPVLYQK